MSRTPDGLPDRADEHSFIIERVTSLDTETTRG
jgi:hypothetical protein